MKLQIETCPPLVRRLPAFRVSGPYGGIAVILAESFGLSDLSSVAFAKEEAKNLKSQIETCPPLARRPCGGSVWRNRKSQITFLTSLFVLLTSVFSAPTPVLSAPVPSTAEGVEGFADGSIVAWGWNVSGQCNIPSPNSGFIAIAAGGGYSLGLKQDGSIVAWGWNNYGQCNIPSPNSGFIAITAGWEHSLAIKKVCQYKLTGDLNDDCRVNLYDFALMSANWLIDCTIDPNNPACVPK